MRGWAVASPVSAFRGRADKQSRRGRAKSRSRGFVVPGPARPAALGFTCVLACVSVLLLYSRSLPSLEPTTT
jgi:hypothetical protein